MLLLIHALSAIIDNLVPKRFQQRTCGPVIMPTILNPRRLYRSYLAWRYLSGDGLEIGALHLPLTTFAGAHVRYVDHLGIEELRRHYPELRDLPLVTPDIIDNGERLDAIPALSQDFIIANHFFEHAEDPIATLERHIAKLKVGGVLYLAVPVRDHSFDRTRPLTTLEHLRQDYQNAGANSRICHFQEWAEMVEGVRGNKAIDNRAKELLARGYSIHFHVWDAVTFRSFLEAMKRETTLPFAIEQYVYSRHNPHEAIAIVKRLC